MRQQGIEDSGGGQKVSTQNKSLIVSVHVIVYFPLQFVRVKSPSTV